MIRLSVLYRKLRTTLIGPKLLFITGVLLLITWFTLNLSLHGLTVNYFKNPEFKGEPFFSATERTISLNRIQERFHTFPQYDFSITWSGWIRIPQDGRYIITTRSDNGSDLFIDGNLLMSNWTAADHIMETGIDLTRGLHSLYISFMQGGGPYDMAVYWTKPGTSQMEQISGQFLYVTKPADWKMQAELRVIPMLLKILSVLLLLSGATAAIKAFRSGTLAASIRWAIPRLVLLSISIVIALVLAEIGVRIFLRSRQPHSEFAAQLQRSQQSGITNTTGPSLNISGLVQPSAYPDVVYELKPRISGTFQNKLIQTNSQGMRDQEYTVTKPPDTFRIIGLGDSIMFGWGVDESESFLSVLEQNLNNPQKDPETGSENASYMNPETVLHSAGSSTYEVLNMAVPGYNTALEAFVLRDKALQFEPDLVIVNFISNDFNLPNFMQTPVKFLNLHRFELFKIINAGWNTLIGKQVDSLIGMDLKDRFGASKEEIDNDPTIPDVYKDIAGIPGFERAMDLIGRISRDRGIPVLIAAQALPDQLPVVTRQCELNGMQFFDINEAFTRYIEDHRISDQDNFRLSHRDTHPNARGHEIIGQLLMTRLLEKERVMK